MARTDLGHAGRAACTERTAFLAAHLDRAAEAVTTRIRRLGPGDMARVEGLLLALDPIDRYARFHSGVSDWWVAAYAHRLDPARAILIGAFCPSSGRLLGLAEAHPTTPPRTVEMAVIVHPSHRRRGLGQRLVAEALAHAFARGAETAEFSFIPSNTALVGLVAALGARFDVLRGHAVIGRAAHAGGAWQKAA